MKGPENTGFFLRLTSPLGMDMVSAFFKISVHFQSHEHEFGGIYISGFYEYR